MGLKEIASGIYPASEEAAVSAMAKIVQVLPERIRRRIDSLQAVAMPQVSTLDVNRTPVGSLTMLSLACRDNEALVFTYRTQDGEASECSVHPHRIVSADYQPPLPHRLGPPARGLAHLPDRPHRRPAPQREEVRTPAAAPRRPGEVRPLADHLGAREIPSSGHRPRSNRTGRGRGRPVRQRRSPGRRGLRGVHPRRLAGVGGVHPRGHRGPLVVHGPPEAIEYMRGWARRLTAATEGEER